MAIIRGGVLIDGNGKVVTWGDTIWAGTGDDRVFSGKGVDFIFAGSEADKSDVRAWGHDRVEGGEEGDWIHYENTTSSVHIWGDDKAGKVSGDDHIWGGRAGDFIWGGGGKDEIHGGAGGDEIDGGKGDDKIEGGEGADFLTGGSGRDTFFYHAIQDSHARFADADRIEDFDTGLDKLNFDSTATGKNFHHIDMAINGGASDEAKFNAALMNATIDHLFNPTHKFEFVTDGRDGWLFADTNGLHKGFDFGIELKGVTDLSHTDLTHLNLF